MHAIQSQLRSNGHTDTHKVARYENGESTATIRKKYIYAVTKNQIEWKSWEYIILPVRIELFTAIYIHDLSSSRTHWKSRSCINKYRGSVYWTMTMYLQLIYIYCRYIRPLYPYIVGSTIVYKRLFGQEILSELNLLYSSFSSTFYIIIYKVDLCQYIYISEFGFFLTY